MHSHGCYSIKENLDWIRQDIQYYLLVNMLVTGLVALTIASE